MIGGGGGPPQLPTKWAEIIEDATATAKELEADGLSVHLLHPGDVTPLPEEGALGVVVPGDEFGTLEDIAGEFDPTEVSVYTAQESGFQYAVVVALDEPSGLAICCPVYLQLGDIADLAARTEQRGVLDLNIRPLSADAMFVLSIDDPGLLFGQ